MSSRATPLRVGFLSRVCSGTKFQLKRSLSSKPKTALVFSSAGSVPRKLLAADAILPADVSMSLLTRATPITASNTPAASSTRMSFIAFAPRYQDQGSESRIYPPARLDASTCRALDIRFTSDRVELRLRLNIPPAEAQYCVRRVAAPGAGWRRRVGRGGRRLWRAGLGGPPGRTGPADRLPAAGAAPGQPVSFGGGRLPAEPARRGRRDPGPSRFRLTLFLPGRSRHDVAGQAACRPERPGRGHQRRPVCGPAPDGDGAVRGRGGRGDRLCPAG